MPIRRFLLTAAAAVAAACSFTACCATCSRGTPSSAGVTHVVIFHLKDKGNAAHRTKIIETAESFRQIPGVLSVSAGPCPPSPRPVVDSSYDVGVSLTFASTGDLQRYQDHPLHKAAAADVLKPLVKKFTVFDFGSAAAQP